MNTAEHLTKIVAKCHKLLALSEKRTPGKWATDGQQIEGNGQGVARSGWTTCREGNADYIAACAGRAEAGWRSTIAAIEFLHGTRLYNGQLAAEILAAWPEELL